MSLPSGCLQRIEEARHFHSFCSSLTQIEDTAECSQPGPHRPISKSLEKGGEHAHRIDDETEAQTSCHLP